MRFLNIFLFSFITFLVVFCTSGSSEVNFVEIPVVISNGKIDADISVSHRDKVKLIVTSDQDGVLHIHGYDIEVEIFENKSSSVEFVAEATGLFKLALHTMSDGDHNHNHGDKKSHDDHGDKKSHGGNDYNEHGSVFSSKVLNPNDSFSFKIIEKFKGSTIPFHDHMQHSVKPGKIIVTNDSVEARNVIIQINDGSFTPNEVIVNVGEIVIWENNTGKKAAITSGLMGGSDEHEGDEKEVIIGNMKVLPK
ncbi:MAG: hypothetical protein CL770_01895 [Chloroflexi bacterium]|nr:hypothetical protein [Chloroflexota bacterium]